MRLSLYLLFSFFELAAADPFFLFLYERIKWCHAVSQSNKRRTRMKEITFLREIA